MRSIGAVTLMTIGIWYDDVLVGTIKIVFTIFRPQAIDNIFLFRQKHSKLERLKAVCSRPNGRTSAALVRPMI